MRPVLRFVVQRPEIAPGTSRYVHSRPERMPKGVLFGKLQQVPGPPGFEPGEPYARLGRTVATY